MESVPLDSVRAQFETNVFGLVRMCQLVLPGMRRAGRGRIVNVSSMGGKLVFPGGGIYHATKHAVEALSDAMRFEVKGLRHPGGGDRARADQDELRGDRGGRDARVEDGPYAGFNRSVAEATAGAYDGPMARLGAGPGGGGQGHQQRAHRQAAADALSGDAVGAPAAHPAQADAGPRLGRGGGYFVPPARRLRECRAHHPERSSHLPYFKDADEVYAYIGKLFQDLAEDEELAPKFQKANTIVQYRYREPESIITVSLREDDAGRVDCGDTDMEPEVVMTMDADTAHRFWLGKVNVTVALARGQMKAKGPVAKILKLVPLTKPIFPRYRAILEESGRQDLLEAA